MRRRFRVRNALLFTAAALFPLASCGKPARPAAARPDAPPAPVRSAPIETPRTVMKALPQAADAPARPAGVRSDLDIPGAAEAPRLPRDYAIGPLGAGEGRAGPYREAVALLAELAAGKSLGKRYAAGGEAASREAVALLATLGPAPAVRAGGPEEEGTGAVSYLVRFRGKSASASGELRLLAGEDGSWLVESLELEADEETEGFDPTIYKRFL